MYVIIKRYLVIPTQEPPPGRSFLIHLPIVLALFLSGTVTRG